MSSLERAIAIAAAAHAGVLDKGGQPYILHPLRVMMSVTAEDERIAAVLHDVVEDTEWTLDRLRAEGFSSAIVDAVDALTKRNGEDYAAFVQRARANHVARVVKLADIADNMDMSRIPEPTERDFERLKKYEAAVIALKAQ